MYYYYIQWCTTRTYLGEPRRNFAFVAWSDLEGGGRGGEKEKMDSSTYHNTHLSSDWLWINTRIVVAVDPVVIEARQGIVVVTSARGLAICEYVHGRLRPAVWTGRDVRMRAWANAAG